MRPALRSRQTLASLALAAAPFVAGVIAAYGLIQSMLSGDVPFAYGPSVPVIMPVSRPSVAVTCQGLK